METEARETGKMRLLSYMKKESKQLAKDGLMGRAGNFDRTRKSFSKYLEQRNRKDIFICSIDNALITGYRDWLTKGGISENSGRSLKLPWWQGPILPEYRADTIEEEGDVGRTMQLRPEALDFGVE